MIAIVTAQNAGKLGKGKFNTAPLLGGPQIQHYHQAIALAGHLSDRVVKKGGAIAGYRWGFRRKRALLEREQSTEFQLA